MQAKKGRFQESPGRSILDEIKRVRLGRSKRLLLETKYRHCESGAARGFRLDGMFCSAFSGPGGTNTGQFWPRADELKRELGRDFMAHRRREKVDAIREDIYVILHIAFCKSNYNADRQCLVSRSENGFDGGGGSFRRSAVARPSR